MAEIAYHNQHKERISASEGNVPFVQCAFASRQESVRDLLRNTVDSMRHIDFCTFDILLSVRLLGDVQHTNENKTLPVLVAQNIEA
jgi:hypothetical protein